MFVLGTGTVEKSSRHVQSNLAKGDDWKTVMDFHSYSAPRLLAD